MKKLILVFLTLALAFGVCAVSAFANTENIEKAIATQEQSGFDILAIVLVPGENNSVAVHATYNDGEDTVEWSESYDITLEQYLELYKANNSNVVYDKATNQTIPANVESIIIEVAKPDDMGVTLEYKGFGQEGFLRNIKYMGLGMLGIFVVVGVVILVTYIFNSSTGKKKA